MTTTKGKDDDGRDREWEEEEMAMTDDRFGAWDEFASQASGVFLFVLFFIYFSTNDYLRVYDVYDDDAGTRNSTIGLPPPYYHLQKEPKRRHNVSWAICMFFKKIISFLRVLTKVLDYLQLPQRPPLPRRTKGAQTTKPSFVVWALDLRRVADASRVPSKFVFFLLLKFIYIY